MMKMNRQKRKKALISYLNRMTIPRCEIECDLRKKNDSRKYRNYLNIWVIGLNSGITSEEFMVLIDSSNASDSGEK